ncbi:nuclear protein [Melanogaster broomeanus]|nr:nuclear protein [Melanogaster broomeanus]
MAQVRARSPSSSPAPTEAASLQKRLKTSHASESTTPSTDPAAIAARFHPGLLEPDSVQKLHASYATSEPFKYAVIEALFQDGLLEGREAGKETDIYKVNQTGDLASLSYLSAAQRALFPGLLALRDALYSPAFRALLQAVTGCGALSGTKQDMSVNSYTKGCHLLNHDDVIGTRRVSYILTEYGGALELYPVRAGPDGQPEPEVAPSKAVPPSWNQFVFFEVQPGKSFHSVEEVVVGADDGRARLSISGWFHAAQEGEDGYVAESPLSELKSSREQLTSSSTTFTPYPETASHHTQTHHSLQNTPPSSRNSSTRCISKLRTMKTLMAQFDTESNLQLHHFLSNELVMELEPSLLDTDAADGLDGSTRRGRVPPHSAGVSGSWTAQGPPHKWRYCTLSSQPAETATPAERNELFPSAAFRAWLSILTRLIPLTYSAEARRFRPGMDYTLATSEDGDSRLDVRARADAPTDDEEPASWQSGEWGGWEEDDPAVYRSGSSQKSATEAEEHDSDDEDGTLLTVQPSFNTLLLVLRDEGVLRFVKYVSAAAPGSRWDVCGEFEVGMFEDGEDEEET